MLRSGFLIWPFTNVSSLIIKRLELHKCHKLLFENMATTGLISNAQRLFCFSIIHWIILLYYETKMPGKFVDKSLRMSGFWFLVQSKEVNSNPPFFLENAVNARCMLGWKLKILIAIQKVLPAYKTTLFYVGRRKLLKNSKINEGAKSRIKSLTVQDIANNVELKFILGYASYSYHTLRIGWWWEEKKRCPIWTRHLNIILKTYLVSNTVPWYELKFFWNTYKITAIKMSLSYSIYYPNWNILYFWHSR